MNRTITLLSSLLLSTAVLAQSLEETLKNVEISSAKVSESVYLLQGYGGNIGVSAGDDGILMIDDQFAPLAEKIAAKLKDIADTDMRYIINTHHHFDHTGSNEYFAKHSHAVLMAHENVRKLMSVKDGKHAKSLPTVTYKDGVKIYINGETVHIRHLPNGHTSGDSYVWFEHANVVHTGDLFFESRFPFIDLSAGGNVDGYIKSVQAILDNTPDDVKIIPGHGKLTDKAGYRKFLAMIKQTQAFVKQQKSQGNSLKAIQKAGLPEQWKPWSWNFINEEKWIATLYH